MVDEDSNEFFCGTGMDPADSPRDYKSLEEAMDDLVNLIQHLVGDPNEWLDQESVLHVLNGNLIVRTHDANHLALEDLLAYLRSSELGSAADTLRDAEVLRLLRRAERHRIAGDRAAALRLTREALAVDPDDPVANAMHRVLSETLTRLKPSTSSQ